MWKSAAIVVSLGVLFAPSVGQQNPAPKNQPMAAPIPVEAAQKANPMKYTAESIARGKRQYGYDCAMCHGKEGDGKGDVATDMKLKVGDFTASNALKDRTDGELFYIIKNGKGDMPPEGDRVKSDLVWDMVNYLRSLSKKDKAPAE
jgi:mono/diheme cytochrome c family protein